MLFTKHDQLGVDNRASYLFLEQNWLQWLIFANVAQETVKMTNETATFASKELRRPRPGPPQTP